jgi:hypothetical protein
MLQSLLIQQRQPWLWPGQYRLTTLDSDRVGVTGDSDGRYMVPASLVIYSDRIHTGTEYFGTSDYRRHLHLTRANLRKLFSVELGAISFCVLW